MQRKADEKVHKAGFISPPAWFDVSPSEFLRIAPKNIMVMQTIMRPPDFDYARESFVKAVPELAACFDSLAAAGADVVAQFGYPFSFAHGWEKARQIQESIQNKNTQFVMMGVETVYALRHLNCQSIAIASTYYSKKTAEMLHEYLKEAGFNILQSENWQSQNIAEDTEAGMFIGKGELDPMDWRTPVHAVETAVRTISRITPDADGILVTGGGMRLLDIVEGLEKETGKPVLSGDLTIYWGILRRLAIKEGVCGQGKLLASLV
jgi:maleate cis-trans isomerase